MKTIKEGKNEIELYRDGVTNAIMTVDYAHHEIHSGSNFILSGKDTINSGESINGLLVTPNTNKQAHIIFRIRGTGEANICLYENTITSNNGTSFTSFNRNRNSNNTATTLTYINPTIISKGLCIYEEHFGVGRSIGGETRGESEFVLKTNTKYLFEINSESALNEISFIIDWYEHTPKNI